MRGRRDGGRSRAQRVVARRPREELRGGGEPASAAAPRVLGPSESCDWRRGSRLEGGLPLAPCQLGGAPFEARSRGGDPRSGTTRPLLTSCCCIVCPREPEPRAAVGPAKTGHLVCWVQTGTLPPSTRRACTMRPRICSSLSESILFAARPWTRASRRLPQCGCLRSRSSPHVPRSGRGASRFLTLATDSGHFELVTMLTSWTVGHLRRE